MSKPAKKVYIYRLEINGKNLRAMDPKLHEHIVNSFADKLDDIFSVAIKSKEETTCFDALVEVDVLSTNKKHGK